MELTLFPGEKPLLNAKANLMLGITTALPEERPVFRADAIILTAKALATFIKGSAVGGELTLTTHRFFFASHGMNRTRGACSLFLPTLVREHIVDGFVSDTLTLETATTKSELVVKDAKKLVEALATARTDAPSAADLAALVRAQPGACGTGRDLLGDVPSVEAINAKLAAQKEGNAIDIVGALNVAELLARAA